MSPNAPTESNSRLRPTRLSSGFVHNSQSLPPQISLPPNPAPLPAVRSPAQSFPSDTSPRNRPPPSPRPRPPTPPSLPRSRCPPPAQSAPPHNSQSFARRSSRATLFRALLLYFLYLPQLPTLRIPRRPRPL